MCVQALAVERWNVYEVTLFSNVCYANPYVDVKVSANFIGPDGQSVYREAFWDGGNIWKIRFAPIAHGRWTWETSSSNTVDKGLHNQSGDLLCTEYKGNNLIYSRGFLCISNNNRHFCHADGTPFFWLGDTHWQMPNTERVDVCNYPGHVGKRCPYGGQFQHLLANRLAHGFTVYQTYPDASASHWWAGSFSRLNPERFRKVFDVQMDRLADAGMVVALGFGHYKNSILIPEADLIRFARYLVARYGAHPVVWITCQEMNAPEKNGKNNQIDVWKAVASEVAKADGYRHPLSAHQWVLDVSMRSLGYESWHDWFALQGGHSNVGLTPQARYKGYYDFSPTKPMVETEAMYERVDCGGVCSTDETRQAAWKALLCGSAGYTYGGAGIWALKWDSNDPRWKKFNYTVDSWHEGVVLPGAAQMSVLKQFFSLINWSELTPRFQDSSWAEWRDGERSVLATISNKLYLVYFYGTTSAGTIKQFDTSSTYVAKWFDPRNGNFVGELMDISAPTGSWDVPDKPSTEDWVLCVEQKPSSLFVSR